MYTNLNGNTRDGVGERGFTEASISGPFNRTNGWFTIHITSETG